MAAALGLQGSAGVETPRRSPHYLPRGKLIGRGWRGSLGRHWPRLRLHSDTGSHGRVQGLKGRWRDQKFGHSGRGCWEGRREGWNRGRRGVGSGSEWKGGGAARLGLTAMSASHWRRVEGREDRKRGLGWPAGPGPAPRWESEQGRTPGALLHCPFSLICVLTAQGPLDQEAVTTQAGPAEAGTRGRCLCLGGGRRSVVLLQTPQSVSAALCRPCCPAPLSRPFPFLTPARLPPCGTSQEPELCPPKPCPPPSQRERSENPPSSLAPQGHRCPSRQSHFWLIPNQARPEARALFALLWVEEMPTQSKCTCSVPHTAGRAPPGASEGASSWHIWSDDSEQQGVARCQATAGLPECLPRGSVPPETITLGQPFSRGGGGVWYCLGTLLVATK